MEKVVLSENELAQHWGVSPKTLQRWRSEGRGPPSSISLQINELTLAARKSV